MIYFKKKKEKKTRLSDPFMVREGDVKNGKLKRGYRLDWTEEVFSPSGPEKETVGKNFDLGKLPKIGLIFLFFLLIVLTRSAWLQIVKGEYYHELAEGNRIRIERIEAKRGIIYDKNFRPLVRNVANFSLYFVPADLPKEEMDKENIVSRVSEILVDISREEIEDILSGVEPGSLESYQPLFIADNIDYEKAMLLYMESKGMPGVILSNKTRRQYDLYSLSLSHLLGYTGKISEKELLEFGQEYLPIDYIGKISIEKFWENELKGVNGKKQIEVDALGKEKKIINQEPGEDGHNLVLSIDVELQKKLEESLADALKKTISNRACAIAMNPGNGEILAMVSLPSYNNNAFSYGITKEEYEELINHPDNPLFNRCISGEYPSGSTIKPVIAAAALEEGIINEHTSFNSVGGIKVSSWFFPDWLAGGHGMTNVRKAIAESVNTFFYYIGGGYGDFQGLGVDKIVKYASLFGLDAQSGIDIIGEADGFLPTKEWKKEVRGENWYIGNTYHLSIGQGDELVTPLQVANFTSVFANGGKLYRPRLVHQVLTGEDKEVGDTETDLIRSDFISEKNINIVRQGMRQAVTTGSAKSLQTVPVAVAGKTGTAQWSSKKDAHAWFTGFAPYDDPEIVITVLVEEGGEGSQVAVPVARDVLNWYFSR